MRNLPENQDYKGSLQKTHWYSPAKSGTFCYLITADHKVLSEGCESRHNHRYAVVVQDVAIQWIQSYQCKATISQETQKSFQKFLEPTRKPKVIYTDNSLNFGKACEELIWNHCTSTPHRSETNGIAERAVRRIEEGTFAVLLQSGSMVEYHPIFAKDLSRLHQFDNKVLPGIFLGYVFHAGGILERDIVVADIEELEETDASEIHAKRLNAKEVLTPQNGGKCLFPDRRWNSQTIWLHPGSPRPRRRARKSSRRIRRVFFNPFSRLIVERW